jgi:hypothetical protein
MSRVALLHLLARRAKRKCGAAGSEPGQRFWIGRGSRGAQRADSRSDRSGSARGLLSARQAGPATSRDRRSRPI